MHVVAPIRAPLRADEFTCCGSRSVCFDLPAAARAVPFSKPNGRSPPAVQCRSARFTTRLRALFEVEQSVSLELL
ncbi:unnamed protein product [Lota lota]